MIPNSILLTYLYFIGIDVIFSIRLNASKIEIEFSFPPPKLYTSAILGFSKKKTQQMMLHHMNEYYLLLVYPYNHI